jgi:hypothetical protein
MFTGIPNDKGDNWVIITDNNRNTTVMGITIGILIRIRIVMMIQ